MAAGSGMGMGKDMTLEIALSVTGMGMGMDRTLETTPSVSDMGMDITSGMASKVGSWEAQYASSAPL